MVRLVFRPYTHVWRSICTSESLRSSTRVSSGFNLRKHSSPSFGSQRMRSCFAPLKKAWDEPVVRSALVLGHIATKILPQPTRAGLHFHFAFRFRSTQWLAHMLNSLVRVSRRVRQIAYNHHRFISVTHRGPHQQTATNCHLKESTIGTAQLMQTFHATLSWIAFLSVRKSLYNQAIFFPRRGLTSQLCQENLITDRGADIYNSPTPSNTLTWLIIRFN